MKRILLFSIGILFVCTAFSQARTRTTLSGKITDGKTGQPLSGASVVLAESKQGTTQTAATEIIH